MTGAAASVRPSAPSTLAQTSNVVCSTNCAISTRQFVSPTNTSPARNNADGAKPSSATFTIFARPNDSPPCSSAIAKWYAAIAPPNPRPSLAYATTFGPPSPTSPSTHVIPTGTSNISVPPVAWNASIARCPAGPARLLPTILTPAFAPCSLTKSQLSTKANLDHEFQPNKIHYPTFAPIPMQAALCYT